MIEQQAPDDLPLFQFGGRTFDVTLDMERLSAQQLRVMAAMAHAGRSPDAHQSPVRQARS